MSRSREFDREAVLHKAMYTFWMKGYEATSVRDLTSAMGIGRQSMYNSFGDKHTLFLECLDLYCEGSRVRMLAPMHAANGGIASIETYFETAIRNMTRGPRIACFLVNSAVEVAPHDAQVAQRSADFSNQLAEALQCAVTVGVSAGEICVEDVSTAANVLRNTFFGLATSSKAGVDVSTLQSVARYTINSMRC